MITIDKHYTIVTFHANYAVSHCMTTSMQAIIFRYRYSYREFLQFHNLLSMVNSMFCLSSVNEFLCGRLGNLAALAGDLFHKNISDSVLQR